MAAKGPRYVRRCQNGGLVRRHDQVEGLDVSPINGSQHLEGIAGGSRRSDLCDVVLVLLPNQQIAIIRVEYDTISAARAIRPVLLV